MPLALAAFAPLGFVVLAALVALAALRRESRDRQPGGSCAIYGTDEQVVVAACVAFVGALLVAIAVRQRGATRA